MNRFYFRRGAKVEISKYDQEFMKIFDKPRLRPLTEGAVSFSKDALGPTFSAPEWCLWNSQCLLLAAAA